MSSKLTGELRDEAMRYAEAASGDCDSEDGIMADLLNRAASALELAHRVTKGQRRDLFLMELRAVRAECRATEMEAVSGIGPRRERLLSELAWHSEQKGYWSARAGDSREAEENYMVNKKKADGLIAALREEA